MKTYQDLLRLVMERGERVPTRAALPSTGQRVSALSVFGARFEHDLADGFPLLTTKRVFFRGVKEELAWMLRGETNSRILEEKGVNIWKGNADKYGDLGPIYGKQWRSWGSAPTSIPQPTPNLREGLERTFLGVANGSGHRKNPGLRKTWQGMIQRCYDEKNLSYKAYGGKGVHVCDRWLEFLAFEEDAKTLPGWDIRSDAESGVLVQLDKDIRGNGFVYSPSSCCWVSPVENAQAKSDKVYTVRRIEDGSVFSFFCVRDFSRSMGKKLSNLRQLWDESIRPEARRSRYGFELVSVESVRPSVDQIAMVVDGIRKSANDPSCPESRRIILSSWDAYWVRHMMLPPCHTMCQWSVRPGGRLDCLVTMRSCDLVLGFPFNLAQYALLTHLLAKVTGTKPGRLHFSFGDLHIYDNLLAQAQEQSTRAPKPLPTLEIRGEVDGSLWNIDTDSILIQGYDPHPALPGEMAVL